MNKDSKLGMGLGALLSPTSDETTSYESIKKINISQIQPNPSQPRKNFKDSDPQEIVIDEFIGQSIPIILFEIFHGDRNYSAYEALQIYLWFFLLFRVFDGLKPFPIDYVDKKFKNSFGILFDDILAGIYVVLCLILFMIGKTYLL